jgi:hypothetical protein
MPARVRSKCGNSGLSMLQLLPNDDERSSFSTESDCLFLNMKIWNDPKHSQKSGVAVLLAQSRCRRQMCGDTKALQFNPEKFQRLYGRGYVRTGDDGRIDSLNEIQIHIVMSHSRAVPSINRYSRAYFGQSRTVIWALYESVFPEILETCFFLRQLLPCCC